MPAPQRPGLRRVLGARRYRRALAERLADEGRLHALEEAPWQGLWHDRARVLVHLAAEMLQVEIAEVNLVDSAHVRCVASAGDQETRVVPAPDSYCQHVVGTAGAVVVFDSLQDPLVALSPSAALIRSYLGIPLVSRGHVLGALCVASRQPRHWSEVEVSLLSELAGTLLDEREWAV